MSVNRLDDREAGPSAAGSRKQTPGGRARTPARRLATAVIYLSLLATCVPPDGGGGGDTDGILAALGFSTDLGPRTDADGNVLGDDVQPLSRSVKNTKPVHEVFVSSTSADPSIELWDWTDSALGLLENVPSTAMAVGALRRPVAVDLDGNGKQEVVLLVFPETDNRIFFYQVDDGSAHTVSSLGNTPWTRTVTGSIAYSTNTYYYQLIDVAAGDIDGDLKDEVVLACEDTLSVFDEDWSTPQTTKTYSPIGGAARKWQKLGVECADIDGDGAYEVLVANGVWASGSVAQICGYRGLGLAETSLDLSASCGGRSIETAEIAAGDVTGDGKPELILAGDWSSGSALITMVMTFAVIGTSESVESGMEFSIAYSTGVIAGGKFTIPVVSNGELKVKPTESSVSYTCPAGEDSVLFTAIPYGTCFYEVISADEAAGAGSQPSLGDVVTLSIQRRSEFLLTSVSFYNEHNGDLPDIDKTVLVHTIGDPSSYPIRAEAGSLLDTIDGKLEFLLSGANGIVPEGERVCTLSFAEDCTVGGSISLEHTIEIEATVSAVSWELPRH